MTNFEYIKSMSNVQMAMMLTEIQVTMIEKTAIALGVDTKVSEDAYKSILLECTVMLESEVET